MSGNIVNRTLDPSGVPASLSEPIIEGLLRSRYGWTGAVVTDDLGAVAITSRYKHADAVARAIEAGNDLLVFANQASTCRTSRPGSSTPSRASSRPAGSAGGADRYIFHRAAGPA